MNPIPGAPLTVWPRPSSPSAISTSSSAGKQAIDNDAGQVGPGIAEQLGISQITYVSEIVSVTEDTLTAKRVSPAGEEVGRGEAACGPDLREVPERAALPHPEAHQNGQPR